MTAFFHTLYPRTTADFASSTLETAPGLVAPGAQGQFRFAIGRDAANTPIELGDNLQIVLELRLVWEGLPAADMPTGFKPIADAEITSDPAVIEIAVAPHAPIGTGGGTIPNYPRSDQMDTTISDTFATVVNGLPIQTGGPELEAPRVGTQTVSVSGDRVRIWIDPDDGWDVIGNGANGFPLQLFVSNHHATLSLRVVFAVGFTGGSTAIGPEVQQKWLNVRRNSALTSSAITTDIPMVNFGTGPSGGAGRVSGLSAPATVGGGAVAVTIPTTALEPGQSQFLRATLAGGVAVVADFEVSIPVGSDDAAAEDAATQHNDTAVVDLDVGALELAMVFDASGSMLGSFAGSTRWQKLKTAVGLVNSVINGFAQARSKASLTIFPFYSDAGNIDSNDARVHVGLETFLPDFEVKTNAALALVEAQMRGSALTPISRGIDRALENLPNFAEGTVRRMLLMSDGLWNRGVDPGTAPVADALIAKHVVPLAVRFIEAGTADNRLQVLVDNVNAGRTPDMGVGTYQEGANFGQMMVNAVAPMLGIAVPDDPDVTVTAENPVQYHEFIISTFDRSAQFAIWWNLDDPERLDIRLFSPRCEEISIDTVDRFPDVIFSSGGSFQTFHFNEKFLRGDGDGDRYGTWRVIITLNLQSPESPDSPIILLSRGQRALASGEESETYTYSLLAETVLTFSGALSTPLTKTGDAIAALTQLSSAGGGVTNASVLLEVTSPVSSFNQFVARNFVSEQALVEARRRADAGEIDPDFWSVKVAALASIGKVFVPRTRKDTFSMPHIGGGAYATIKTGQDGAPGIARFPGTYGFKAIASSFISPVERFTRFAQFNSLVSPVIDAASTTTTVTFGPGGTTGTVRVWPFDAFGNPLLFDPALEQPFTIGVRGGALQGPLSALQDASYVQQATFDPAQKPVVEIFVPGSAKPTVETTLPQIGNLVFVDTLLRFRPGGEIGDGNQHENAAVVLGPYNPADDFVSLGSEGLLIVAAKDASSPREVAVFAALDTELRSYRVEINTSGNMNTALSNPEAGPWLTLGESAGATARFPIEGIPGAVAVVRIKDLSRREVSSSGSTATPGASLFAVGFVATVQPNPQVSIDDVALCATGSLRLGSNVRVIEQDNSPGILANSGTGKALEVDGVVYSTSIAAGTKVGDTLSLGNVFGDGSGAQFDGNVFTSGTLRLRNGAVVTPGHSVHQGVSLTLPNLSGFIKTFPKVGTTPITVNARESRTLFPNPPNGYADVLVNSGGTLILSSQKGVTDPVFFFESFTVQNGATLDVSSISGVVEIQVRKAVTFRGNVKVKAGRANLLIVAAGSQEFLIESPFIGTAVAPTSTLRIQGAARDPGQLGIFAAKDIVVEPGWTIRQKRRG